MLVIAIAALNTGNNLLFLIVSALLASIAVSGAASAAELRALELAANFPEHAFAKKACPAHITIRNRSRWLPALSIAVVTPRQNESKKVWHWEQTKFEFPKPSPKRQPWVRLPDLKLERSEKTKPPSILRQPLYFPFVGPKGSAGAELALYFERRGRYVQNTFGLSTRFPFSFLIKTRNVILNRELIVYPKVEQTEEFYEMLPLITGEFENHVRGRGHDLYRIRDYLPEDSARHVDWKASAKSGVLKIREFAREDEHRLRIVFDNANPGMASAERYERGVSLAASLAFYLAEQNASLTFAAQGLGEPTLWGFLHHLALVEPADDRRFSIRFRWGRTSTWYLAGGRAERLSLPCGSLPTWCFSIRKKSEKFSRDAELFATYTVHHFQAAWGSRNTTCIRIWDARGKRAWEPFHEYHS